MSVEYRLFNLDVQFHFAKSYKIVGFPSGAVVKNPPADAGDMIDVCWIPGLERSPGGGNDNPLQYSFLENSMDRGAWWATVHGVAKSQTQLSLTTKYRLQSSQNTGVS